LEGCFDDLHNAPGRLADIACMTARVPARNQTLAQDSGQIHVEQKFHPAVASLRGTTRSSMAQAA
jgi:hypothetical protein